MGVNYSKMLTTAQKLISANGGTVSVKVVTTGAYNPATGQISNTTTLTDYDAVRFPYSNKDERLLADTVVASEMSKLLFAGDVDVELGGEIVVNGVTYSVAYIGKLAPNTVDVITTEIVVIR